MYQYRQVESKRIEKKIHHTHGNQGKAGVAVWISDKTDFKEWPLQTDKRVDPPWRHNSPQCVHQTVTLQSKRSEKWWEAWGEVDRPTAVFVDFSGPSRWPTEQPQERQRGHGRTGRRLARKPESASGEHSAQQERGPHSPQALCQQDEEGGRRPGENVRKPCVQEKITSRVHEEPSKTKQSKTNKPIRKWAKVSERHFTEEMAKQSMKRCSESLTTRVQCG